jgi:SAM-dependent methyltransferase
MAAAAPELHGRLLDVGCGRKPYRQLFQVDEYVGLEIDSVETRARGQADHYYDGRTFPFPDGRFEAVICNQVLEHVFNPHEFVQELARVLSPGGRLLLTVPFVWDEHEQPHDYARYSSFGLRHLLGTGGFQIRRQSKTLANFAALAQLTNAYVFKVTRTRSTVLNLLVTVLLMAPISFLGQLLGRLLPRNPDLFLDSIIVAEKPR